MKNLLTWLTIPPVISVPIIIVTYLISEESGSIPYGIWIPGILLILALTVIYIRTSSYGISHWRAPLQLIAQGVVVSFLAIQFVLPLLSWLGVLLILIGLILLCSVLFFENSPDTAKQNKSDDIFSNYPYPAFVTDKSGSAISTSHGFAQLISTSKGDNWPMIINKSIQSGDKIKLGEKLLQVVKQESQDKIWYTLKEESLSQQVVTSTGDSETSINDFETRIFSKEYCRIRTEEEIVRIKRYKRWAVFMLIRINFTEEESINKQSELGFFSSFCQHVKNTLRTCDTVSRVDEFSIFIILPETLSDDPVNEIIKKIMNFSHQLSQSINQLKCKISPEMSHIFYNASSQDMSFNDILAALISTLSEQDYT